MQYSIPACISTCSILGMYMHKFALSETLPDHEYHHSLGIFFSEYKMYKLSDITGFQKDRISKKLDHLKSFESCFFYLVSFSGFCQSCN